MSGELVPIRPALATTIIALLGKLKDYPAFRHEGAEIVTELGEAISIAHDFEHRLGMYGAELICAVNGATGRQIETTLTADTVKQAKAALEQTAPVLGNVIALPRAPERETAASIDAAVAKALLDLRGPISVRRWVDHVEREPFPTWVAPFVGEIAEHGTRRIRTYLVRRVGPNAFEAFTLTLCDSEECNKW